MYSVVNTDRPFFSWWNECDDDDYGFENVIVVMEDSGMRVTAIEVPDESIRSKETPYDVVFLPDQLSALVAISQEYLAAMRDECENGEKALMTVGTFLGHLLTNAMNELLDTEEE